MPRAPGVEGVLEGDFKIRTFALMVAFASLSGCVQPQPKLDAISSSDILAAQSRVVDCEYKAANRFDDGRQSMTTIAQQVMGVCSVERIKAKLTVHLSPDDPELEAGELTQAINIIERTRKLRKAG